MRDLSIACDVETVTLAKAMFGGTDLIGLEHNDDFYMDCPRVRTRTNRSGGVQGGEAALGGEGGGR